MDTPEPDEIEDFIRHRAKYEDTPESAQRTVQAIDARIAWLAARGLRPHPTVIERRADYARKASPQLPDC